MTSLGLPSNSDSGAYGVNADGSVVVGNFVDAYGPHTFRWTSALGAQSITNIFVADGVNLTGWQLADTTGVSADGTVIVGFGTDPGGRREGWIAQIPVNAFALLDLQGVDHSIGSLVWGGIVTNSRPNNPATLTVGDDNSSTTFAGTIEDGASTTALTKIGTGTLTLTGINTYTGGTTISAGTLELGDGSGTGSIAGQIIIEAGTLQINDAVTISAVVIDSGGTEIVESGGTANSTQVGSGGVDYVFSGGEASDTAIGPLGTQIDYGTVSGNTVLSGGYDYVALGGIARGTQVTGGGYEFVGAGGITTGTEIGSGGAGFSLSSGTASATLVGSGGLQIVQAAGADIGATVDGGVEYVLPGAGASGSIIGAGGVEVDFGVTSHTLAGSGGYDLIEAGGTANGAAVSNGSEYVLSGGTASGTTVTDGLEANFGNANATVLNNGGSEFDEAGATASGTTINSGSIDCVLPGATASGSTLDGGTQIVYGMVARATVIAGTQAIEAGGSATAAVLSGGFQDILSGGVAIATTISASGYEYAFAGGTASATTISGGTLELASGGSTGSGAVTFAGSGMLILDDSAHFGGLVAGFGLPDAMDLADIPFVASKNHDATTVNWTQLTSASGSLLVAQGTHSATLTLLGQYSQGNFNLHNDGAGATLVTDPPALAMTDAGPFAVAAAHQQ
jgi:autotransporter-associated beta strand protein/autotransporter passenger strand-loop-strand repeat protein